MTSSMSSCLGNRLGRGPVVAGEHDDPYAFVVKILDRLRRRFFDRVGNADKAGGLSINGNEHYRLAFVAQGFCLCRQAARIDPEFIEELAVAERDAWPSTLPDDPFAGLGLGNASHPAGPRLFPARP